VTASFSSWILLHRVTYLLTYSLIYLVTQLTGDNIVLLRLHFKVRTMTALHWPGSELPYVMGRREVFLLHSRNCYINYIV
jgi:hypothetical protein